MKRASGTVALAALGAVLAACSSTGRILEPAALIGPRPASPYSNLSVSFAPVVGAPEAAANVLGARISAKARELGLTIEPTGEGGNYGMRGYFSAFSEAGRTTVVYVWDVLDAAGNRVHRIQGQEQTPGGSGEGWAAVSDATMVAVADQTLDQLVTWLASIR